MATEYRLTLEGDIPLEQVATLAAAEATEAPASPNAPRLFTADLYGRYGYTASVYAGRNGYYDAEDDGSGWEWEPETYVNVSFRMARSDPSERGTPNMVMAVARILAGRPEDAAQGFGRSARCCRSTDRWRRESTQAKTLRSIWRGAVRP